MAKTFQHPVTGRIKHVGDNEPVTVAALKKAGYEELTAADIEGEPELTVTQTQVDNPHGPAQSPTVPVLDAPAKETATKNSDKGKDGK